MAYTLMLFWIELYRRSQDKTDIKDLKYGFTLEHIMLRKLQENWKKVHAFDNEGNKIEVFVNVISILELCLPCFEGIQ